MDERANKLFYLVNYDFKNRKREQGDFREQFEENGSIYICKTKKFTIKKIDFFLEKLGSIKCTL